MGKVSSRKGRATEPITGDKRGERRKERNLGRNGKKKRTWTAEKEMPVESQRSVLSVHVMKSLSWHLQFEACPCRTKVEVAMGWSYLRSSWQPCACGLIGLRKYRRGRRTEKISKGTGTQNFGIKYDFRFYQPSINWCVQRWCVLVLHWHWLFSGHVFRSLFLFFVLGKSSSDVCIVNIIVLETGRTSACRARSESSGQSWNAQ